MSLPLRPLLCVLLLGAGASGARASATDPLWARYQDPGLSARERLTALHEVIHGLRSSDVDSSRALAERMRAEAVVARDTLMIALAERDLGLAAILQRDNDRARLHLERALALYLSEGDSAGHRGAGATLSSLGMVHKNAGRMQEAVAAYRRSMSEHVLARDEEGTVYALNGLGRVHEIQGAYDSALVYYSAVAEVAARVALPEMEAAGYGNMANVNAELGRFGEAIDLTYRSLALMERLGDKRGMATCLTGVSSLKDALGEHDDAYALLHKAHALYTEVGYRQGMMTAGTSLGAMLLARGKVDSAALVLERALSLVREAEARDLMGRPLRDLAAVRRAQHRHAEAETLLSEAVALARELGDAPGEARAQIGLGLTALAEGRAVEAARRCMLGEELASDHQAVEESIEACSCLHQALKAQGRGMEALRYHETWVMLRDSLANDRTARQLTRRDMLHSFNKRQLADSMRHATELDELETARTIEALRADRNRARAWAVGGGGLLLLLGGGLWFRTDRKRRRERFEKEAAHLETQALRSQMNPHFIFNALNSINAFIQRNESDDASSYLTRFARVMRSVLENSRHATVPLHDDLETLRGYMDLERRRLQEKFDFTIRVHPDIDPQEVQVPPLVVQPFVENAIWHGVTHMEGKGHITLAVEPRGTQLLWIIEDDGVGRNAPKAQHTEQPTKKTSLGTAITRSRLDLVQKQHDGHAGFRYVDRPTGTRVEVEMPLLRDV
ncbi:MAG: tetratricopeptide repeat protein [Flavobacteriales bacterium]|nr:tetratricopeptide repeat protein [Flavobacteriales bacterium]MBK7942575.1 tetratricopeptide repeat protein [Flavobacteriales bacterium]MBK9699022.1 tetratricopeptide repeat protein [Flavobacteriales bacterium]